MPFAKMLNMARSPQEMKEDNEKNNPQSTKLSGPLYPYGLCLSLDKDTLEKLGLDGKLPTVGEVLQFSAMAKVTSVSENEREDAEGNKTADCRVELQITDMGIPGMEADQAVERSEARRERFYSGDDNDDGK